MEIYLGREVFCNVKLFKEIGGFDPTLIRLAEIDFWIKATFNNIQLVSTNKLLLIPISQIIYFLIEQK